MSTYSSLRSGSLENYFEAKAKMFKNPKFAVFNAKDEKIRPNFRCW